MDKRQFHAPANWQIDKVFEQNGFVVEVSKNDARRPTQYSLRMGVRRPDGSLAANIPVRKVDDITSGVLDRDYFAELGVLLAEAVNYISAEVGWEWHQWVESRIEREERQTRGNQPDRKVRDPGKTARKKARRGNNGQES